MTPALAKARSVDVPRRVQGITSTLDDIVLRSGKGLREHIGGAILPTPTLKRGMGNSTVEISIHDPKLEWLRTSLSGEKWDARIDGLWFRYLGTSKSGKQLTLRFEDLHVARLRERMGPISQLAHRGKPNEVTRAEFVVSLIREALPGVRIVCPELHERQPIESGDQGKQAQRDAEVNREKGIGDVRGLTIKGEAATKEQINLGDRAIRTAESLDAPAAVIVAMMAALILESLLGKVSRNFMQMTPETASASKYSPTVLEEAVTGFLKGYVPGHEGALAYARKNPDAKPYEIAQAVQKSGAGEGTNGAGNYGPWVDEAREWLDSFGGGGGSGTATVVKAFTFEVGKKETYWTAIQRLADEVNFRAFFVGDRFFYISEEELSRSQARLAIELDDEGRWSPDGIEDVDFDYNENKRANTGTITAFVKGWGVPPGAVFTLAGCGPASIGFGDAPLKPNKKGQRIGISSARKAKTGEGRGRYIVTGIEVPLSGKGEARQAKIAFRRPTPPRPEPANETSSKSEGSDTASGDAPEKARELHAWCERQVGKPYAWGAVGPDSYDCSGFVSAGLMEVGLLGSRLTTSTFASYGEAGVGEYITIHDNNTTGNAKTEHIIIEVLGDLFECGGVSGGVGKPPAGYERDFPTKRHPKGY